MSRRNPDRDNGDYPAADSDGPRTRPNADGGSTVTNVLSLGGARVSRFNGPFYAYAMSWMDENSGRTLMTFASRAIADEWWRAISNKDAPRSIYSHVRRNNPQFYSYNSSQYALFNFFADAAMNPIADKFRGKVFFTLLSDRGGRTMEVIPNQDITDYVNGQWFFIHCTTSSGIYWAWDEDRHMIVASSTQRTPFHILCTDLSNGDILIDSDTVQLQLKSRDFVNINDAGALSVRKRAYRFDLGQLRKGYFAIGKDGGIYEEVEGGEQWELLQ